MIPENLVPLANHLWQSTLFVALMWLLTLALRKNSASVRYWIWFVASIKFLIPFTLLVSLGSHFEWQHRPAVIQAPAVSSMIEEVSQPFDLPSVPQTVTPPPSASRMPAILLGIWFCGFAIGIASWLRWFVGMCEARRLAKPLHWDHVPIPVMSSAAKMEPGVFGILRSVLLLPEGITERLTPEQLETIVAHELCHVRRRDNLTAAIHMVVETIFWFHPLVWWIRTRLIEERERACDEAVLQTGQDPHVYATAILTVCEFCLASPLMDLAGVTGANLKKRVEAIIANRTAAKLTYIGRSVVAAIGLGLLAVPILLGSMQATQPQAPSAAPLTFEVASIKPVFERPSGLTGFAGPSRAGILNIGYQSLKGMIVFAYGVQESQVSGGPKWLDSDMYAVTAKMEGGDIPDPFERQAQAKLMLQTFLADRFKLKIHRESKEASGYELVVAKEGAKLTKATDDESAVGDRPGQVFKALSFCPQVSKAGSTILLKGQSTSQLAACLTGILHVSVVDRTAIQGSYDFTVSEFERPDAMGNKGKSSADDPPKPSIFTALQEQLGLKLESRKVPIELLVIDQADKPTENVAVFNETAGPTTPLRTQSTPQEKYPGGSLSTISAKQMPTKSDTAPVTFEEASIRLISPTGRGPGPGLGGCGPTGVDIDPHRFVLTGATLYRLIAWAYGSDCVYASKYGILTRGPDWMQTDQFDIQGLIPEGAPKYSRQQVLNRSAPQLQLMVLSLLTDRFKLAMHTETKEAPVYMLTVAKGGSKLRPFEEGTCVNPGLNDARVPGQRICASYLGGRKPPNMTFDVVGGSIAGFVRLLGVMLDRPVIDKTGIAATFDLHLEYAPEDTSAPMGASPAAAEPTGPSIFTALQEQAGLKLEATKGQVQVFVIDHAEKLPQN